MHHASEGTLECSSLKRAMKYLLLDEDKYASNFFLQWWPKERTQSFFPLFLDYLFVVYRLEPPFSYRTFPRESQQKKENVMKVLAEA